MHENMSSNLVKARARVDSVDPWLILLDITLQDGTKVCIARNTDAIVYQGKTYQPVSFEIDFGGMQANGEIPTISIKVFNCLESQEVLEHLDGGIGSSIKVSLILYDTYNHMVAQNPETNTEEDFSDLELYFDVMQAKTSKEWITFSLGMPNPLKQRHPLHKYGSKYCRWKFKSVECSYFGADTACQRSLSDCKKKGNSARFGGFPGLEGGGGIRVV